jgi:hypothetical protein
VDWEIDMHIKAKQWDKEQGFDTSFGTGKPYPKDKPLPQNRPCDWCGEIVVEGFIHLKCRIKEQEVFMDILY